MQVIVKALRILNSTMLDFKLPAAIDPEGFTTVIYILNTLILYLKPLKFNLVNDIPNF